MQREKTDLAHALNKHKVALSSFQKAPEEKTIARRATISALGALKRQVSDRKAQNLLLEKLNLKLMQKALLAFHGNTSKKFDRFSATVSTGVVGNFLELDQPLPSRLARDVSKLCPES